MGGWREGPVSGGVNQRLRLKESAVCGARCARKEDGADPVWKREFLNGAIQEEGRRKRSWWWGWDAGGSFVSPSSCSTVHILSRHKGPSRGPRLHIPGRLKGHSHPPLTSAASGKDTR